MIISYFKAKKTELNAIVIIVMLFISICPLAVYGQSSNEFGYKLLPEKLLEYTDGTLQVFVIADNLMIPKGIDGLKATSTDNSIIKIIGIEPANEYITNVKIQAVKPGDAKIALAAPNFLSQEIPITVYNNNNFPTQIQMKITPSEFPVDGPKNGYIGIELLTTSGLPTNAEKDTLIKFSTPNSETIKLKENEILIKKGEYFAINEFEVLSSGEPIIFAETEGMKRISQFIKAHDASKPYKIQVYAYPSTFTSYSNPTAYLIVQLQDADGVPVIAEKDIHISITASSPSIEINTSKKFDQVVFSQNDLIIQKDSYTAVTSFTPRPDLGDYTDSDFQIYTISASTDDYISTSTNIQVIHERIGGGQTGQIKGGVVVGEGPAKFTPLPFLTSGKYELIGVLYLEAEVFIKDQLNFLENESGTIFASISDKATLPVMASKDVEFNIDSSYLKTVNIIDPVVKKGTNSALVFGNTGTIAPKDCEMIFYLNNKEGITTITGQPYGPVRDSLSLTVEPVIPKVLAGANFPVIAYLTEAEESEGESCYTVSSSSEEEEGSARFGVTQFTDDAILTFSATEYADIEPAIIKQNQPFVLINAKSNKVGQITLDVRGSDLASQFSFEAHTTEPTSFALTFPITTLPHTNALLALQVLDSAENPVYAKEDIEITLVSNNESVIEIPTSLIIPKDDYRTIFEINTKDEGKSEIALLSEDLPLAKFDLNVKGLQPKLSMNIDGSGLVGEVMTATVSVAYPGVNLSAEGMMVEWDVSGAEVIEQSQLTDEKGQALIKLVSHNPSITRIKAIVNGLGVSNAESSGSYTFEHPEGYVEIAETNPQGLGGLVISDSQLIYIIAPAVAAGAFLFLKRTNRLEEITEKLPIGGLGEKFEEIKERISEIKDRR